MKDQLTDEQRKLVEETLALLGGYGPPEHAIAVAILRGATPATILAAWNAWVAKFNGDAYAATKYAENDYHNYLFGALLGQKVVEPNSQPTNFGRLTCNENEIMSRLLHPTHPTDILGQPVDVAQRNAYKAFLLFLALAEPDPKRRAMHQSGGRPRRWVRSLPMTVERRATAQKVSHS